MLKIIATVVRREGVTHDELVKVWEQVHAPHVIKMANPLRYRITFFDPQQTPEDSGLDGMAEIWFRDKEHFTKTIGREAGPQILADRFNEFADLSKGSWLPVIEHIKIESPTTPDTTKLVFFITRREGVERADFEQYWLERHMPQVVSALQKSPTVKRYLVDLVDSSRELPYDGIVQIWLEGPPPRFVDLRDCWPEKFVDFIRPLSIARGREIQIKG